MTKSSFPLRSFLSQTAAIAIPIALQNLLTTTGSMIDTMMVGSLGETSIGAVGLCAQFSSLMFSGYWGFVGGGMLFFSQYYGANDEKGIRRAYGLTLTCMMTVGLLFAMLAICFPSLVMRLYTDKTAFQELGIVYLRIAGFAYPLQVLSMAMSSLLRSTERVKLPLIGAICSVVTNCVLNYLLIYGSFGFPKMGIRGAALATVASALVNVLVLVVLAQKRGYRLMFGVKSHFQWTRDFVGTYFTKCFPILCNEVLIGVGNMLINLVLGRQSAEAIAAIAIVRTLEGLVIGFFAGFSNAASVLVGKEVGAGNLETAYQRAWRMVYLCQIVIGCLVAILALLRFSILGALGLSGESLRLGGIMVLIYSVAAIIRMGNWVQNDTYRSAGDATYGTVFEIVFMFVMVLPCVYLTGMVWHLSFPIVFASVYVDEIVRYVLMQRHMYSSKWIRPVTEEGRAALPGFLASRKGR